MNIIDAHSDWTFDIIVHRKYRLSGRNSACPSKGTRIRRLSGDEFLVYEVLNILTHDVSRNVWQVEVRFVEKQREVEFTVFTEVEEECPTNTHPYPALRSLKETVSTCLKETRQFMRDKTGY